MGKVGTNYNRVRPEHRKLRDERIMELRTQGVPVSVIAKRVGLSVGNLHQRFAALRENKNVTEWRKAHATVDRFTACPICNTSDHSGPTCEKLGISTDDYKPHSL